MSQRRRPPDADELEQLAPDAYAGQWLDEHGRLHVAYCDQPERHAREAQERLRLSRRIVVVHHRRSLRELRETETTASDARWWEQYGAKLYSVAVDERENRVDIGVEPLTDAAQAAAEERFGDSVRVMENRIMAC